MKGISNIYLGSILKEELLIPLERAADRLSKEIASLKTRLSQIIKKRRSILLILR